MAQFDWMTDPGFRDVIDQVVRRVAGANGMKEYQAAITDRLVRYAEEHREVLVEKELLKTASAQRSQSDALESVELLIREASAYAANEGRRVVTTADLDRAYKAKFCMVWPFCGKGR